VMRKYILVWKRRCADVRAGTQAPPLPFSNTHRRSAKVKTKILMLAVTLQAMKRENIVPALHGDDKTAKILFPRRTVTIKRENIVPALHGDDKRAKISFPRRAVTIKRQKYCSRAAR